VALDPYERAPLCSRDFSGGEMLRLIPLLALRDGEMDGVTEYCNSLRRELPKHGFEVQVARVPWDKIGWPRALWNLFRESAAWRGQWVLLQYTALGWSRRGFPVGALVSVAILRLRGARCAIFFHEPSGAGGPRLIDRIRRAFQDWTVRTLHRVTEKSVITVPLDAFPWLSRAPGRVAYIPLAPNIPENLAPRTATSIQSDPRKTVVVFCVSEPPHQQREISEIVYAARAAAAAGIQVRVIFLGRGTVEAREEIERAFQGAQIEVCNRGICERTEVTRIFSESDVMLAVRGRLYLRRSSAIHGLACGLPVIGYAGASEGTVIEEAGIALVPYADKEALGVELCKILTNPELWREMHEKNLRVQRDYLSWDATGATYAEFFAGKSD
jgi:glycosyltransferase involved in cell wall biosynthesis